MEIKIEKVKEYNYKLPKFRVIELNDEYLSFARRDKLIKQFNNQYNEKSELYKLSILDNTYYVIAYSKDDKFRCSFANSDREDFFDKLNMKPAERRSFTKFFKHLLQQNNFIH